MSRKGIEMNAFDEQVRATERENGRGWLEERSSITRMEKGTCGESGSLRHSFGRMNSTLLSPPPPPVNPCNGNPPVVQIMPSESQSKWNSIRSCHQPRTALRISRNIEAEKGETRVYRSGKGKVVSWNCATEVKESVFTCS